MPPQPHQVGVATRFMKYNYYGGLAVKFMDAVYSTVDVLFVLDANESDVLLFCCESTGNEINEVIVCRGTFASLRVHCI